MNWFKKTGFNKFERDGYCRYLCGFKVFLIRHDDSYTNDPWKWVCKIDSVGVRGVADTAEDAFSRAMNELKDLLIKQIEDDKKRISEIDELLAPAGVLQ